MTWASHTQGLKCIGSQSPVFSVQEEEEEEKILHETAQLISQSAEQTHKSIPLKPTSAADTLKMSIIDWIGSLSQKLGVIQGQGGEAEGASMCVCV